MPSPRKTIRRLTVDIQKSDWPEFEKALARRAHQLSIKAKTTIKPEFSQWLRDKMRETVDAYR